MADAAVLAPCTAMVGWAVGWCLMAPLLLGGR